jgi:outer membrane receptor for ferrienterochelin and colicins
MTGNPRLQGRSTMYKKLFAAAGTTALVFATNARAQSIDYGSLEQLFGEPVTTSATGTPQKATNVAANMTIITADQIRQSGERDVAAVLSRVPGLDILRTSSTVYDVGVRGYQQSFQPRILVLIDGRQVFLDGFSRTAWDNLPVNIDDIRQIEVVKGASSALFGSNAAGAMVNIITYSPLYDDNNVASVTLGTQATREADGTMTAKLGSVGGIKLSAGGLLADEFDSPRPANEAEISKNPYKNYFAADSLFQLAPNVQASLAANYARDRADTGNIQTVISTNYTTTYSIRGGLEWDSDLGSIKFDNYWNHLRLEPNPPGGGPCGCFDNNLIDSTVQDQFKLGTDNTFRIAAEYSEKDAEVHVIPLAFDVQAPAVAANVFSLSGTWLWQITPQLSWTNAARIDDQNLRQTGTLSPLSPIQANQYNQTIDPFSANSGLVWEPNDVDTYRLTYGRGVQIPGLLEYGFADTTKNANGQIVDVVGNPFLRPTVVTNYEFDYDRSVPTLDSTARFALYYEDNEDVKSPFHVIGSAILKNGTPVVLEEDVNVGNSRGLGGELQLTGQNQAGFRWDASYSYALTADDPGVTAAGGYANSTPVSHFRLIVGYTTGPWEFDVNGQYLTSSILDRSNVRTLSPDYTDVTGRIGYKVTDQVTLALEGTNLAQANTQESPFPTIERQVFVTLSTKF